MRIVFATDLRGSEVSWRKFLNAGAFHHADVLIMGGELTGRAMVPFVADGSGWRVTFEEQPYTLSGEAEVRTMETRIADRGSYPVRLSRDELEAWAADAVLVDRRFVAEIRHRLERWMAMAVERLAGTAIRCLVAPAADGRLDLAPLLASTTRVELAAANVIALEAVTLLSVPWANPTLGSTCQTLPEDELAARIEALVAAVPDPARAIFNFHAPPYGSNLDAAPLIYADLTYAAGCHVLVPVGSHAVRRAIAEHGPVLSLHGHIPESRGAVKLGRTLAVNPGSAAEHGVLHAAVVDLDPKTGAVERYVLVNG